MAEPLVQIEDLVFAYGDRQVLNRVSLSIHRGEFVALVGENGAGKTTLAKHLNGTLKPSSGQVVVCGVDTRTSSIGQLAAHVGYCYQNPDNQIFSATIQEEIEFGARNLGRRPHDLSAHVKEILEIVGLNKPLDSYPFSLSKGERQKLAVASILAMEPDVMVIDEPTTGLDWRGSIAMMDLMRRLNDRGHTLVMITHDMRLVADYARRVVVMAHGRIVADSEPRTVFASPQALRDAHLQPPQVVRFMQWLESRGVVASGLSVDEAARSLRQVLQGVG